MKQQQTVWLIETSNTRFGPWKTYGDPHLYRDDARLCAAAIRKKHGVETRVVKFVRAK